MQFVRYSVIILLKQHLNSCVLTNFNIDVNPTSEDAVDDIINQQLMADQLTGEDFGPDFTPFNFTGSPHNDEGAS
jgi:hypothetical protein